MATIQFITLEGNTKRFNPIGVVETSFSTFHAFDDFDINLIDFTDDKIWCSLGSNVTTNVICYKELLTLYNALNIAKHSRTIILLPGNISYKYYKEKSITSGGHVFRNSEQLKNIIPTVLDIVSIVNEVSFGLVFSNTNTRINECVYESDFVFSESYAYNPLTYSEMSREITTLYDDSIIFTTLNVDTSEKLEELLRAAKLVEEKSDVPNWMDSIEMFDDKELKAKVVIHENAILDHQGQINSINKKLDENNKYKSILYSNSDELVDVIIEILEDMLLCDLSKFEDKKIEDFSFEHDGYYYIGEIKGISSNVKSTNITQLELHYGNFITKHPEIELDKIKKLLIINHQRKIPPLERSPIDDRQITIADNYGSLIIETSTLLKIYEEYRSNKMTTDECYNLLNQTGLLSV